MGTYIKSEKIDRYRYIDRSNEIEHDRREIAYLSIDLHVSARKWTSLGTTEPAARFAAALPRKGPKTACGVI